MTKDKQTHRSRFHKAKDDAQFAQQATSTPQTASEAYKLAFQDTDFLLREDLRPVRFQLELLKPELLLDEAKIESTLVIYGSARIPEPDQADGLEAAATDDASRNIARRLKADLFISIHADAAENEEAHGASVYTLSEVASDREAARLAARENKANIINGVDLGAHSGEVSSILLDLTQRETMNVASDFARLLQREAADDVTFRSTAHRFASFVVLKAPDTPSVLFETGFISNKDDSEFLASVAGQKKVARGVRDAIQVHFARQIAAVGR